MKGMKGCKYFRCDACNKLKPIRQQHIEKVAYTKFSHKSIDKLIFTVYHVQMCEDCKNTKKKKAKK